MTTSVVDPAKARPGDLIGYRRDGRPIRLQAGGHTNPFLSQYNFRGRDDAFGLNTTSGWKALSGVDWSQDIDVTFRVRIGIAETAGATVTASAQLQYSLNAGTWTNVTTTSSVVKGVASAQFNEGDAVTSSQLTGGVGTFTNGSASEDGAATDLALLSQKTEWEYALQIVGADVANNDVIGLRVTADDYGVSSTNIPAVTVIKAGAPPTIDADASLTTTAGRDADAIKVLNGNATSAVTAGLDATANTTQVAAVTMAAAVDIVVDAEIVSAVVEADATSAVTAGLTADAAKILNGDATSTITVGITADAINRQAADAIGATTISITADADVIVPGGTIFEADATTAITAGITAAAAKILDGDTTITTTASITADAQVLGTHLADATLDVTAATTATANLIAAADTTLAAAVTIVADASVILAATADMATTVTIISDGDIPPEVTRGQVFGRHRPVGTTTGWTRLLAAVSARARPMPTVSGG